MKYCKACGSPMMDAAMSCPKCGHVMTKEADEELLLKKKNKINGLALAGFIIALSIPVLWGISILLYFTSIAGALIGSIMLVISTFVMGIIAIVFGAVAGKTSRNNISSSFAKVAVIVPIVMIALFIILFLVGAGACNSCPSCAFAARK